MNVYQSLETQRTQAARGCPLSSDLTMDQVMAVASDVFHEMQRDFEFVFHTLRGETSLGDPSFRVPLNDGVLEVVARSLGYCIPMALLLVFIHFAVSPIVLSVLRVPPDLRDKFVLPLRETVFYSLSCLLNVWMYWHTPWAWWTSGYKDVFRTDTVSTFQPEDATSPGVRVSYFFEVSWYLCTLFLLFIDFKRKDFLVMLCHHLVTLMLLTLSWSVGWTRAGVVLLLLHDFSDVFLNFGKMGSYLDAEIPANGSFVIFVVSWGFLRLYCLPRVIYECFALSPFLLDFSVSGAYAWKTRALVWGMSALVVMHIYWYALILKMAVGMLMGEEKVVKDTREANHKPKQH